MSSYTYKLDVDNIVNNAFERLEEELEMICDSVWLQVESKIDEEDNCIEHQIVEVSFCMESSYYTPFTASFVKKRIVHYVTDRLCDLDWEVIQVEVEYDGGCTIGLSHIVYHTLTIEIEKQSC